MFAEIKIRTKTLITEQIINVLEQKLKNRTLELQEALLESEQFQNNLKAKEAEIITLKKQIKSPKNKKIRLFLLGGAEGFEGGADGKIFSAGNGIGGTGEFA